MKLTDWLVELDMMLGLSAMALLGALSQAASTESMNVRTIIAGVVMSTFVLALVYIGLESIEMDETLRLVLAGVAGYSARYILQAWNLIMERLAHNPIKMLSEIAKIWRGKG
ncbi:hypothetical protein VSVS12_03232 [Vibrio scophthalmi]|uniref:Holin n=2 Tax=Vibrio TaxID=662 RepID=F9S4B1_9VIBR|nr:MULTISPECIES: hypothetical protein [Vibrio]ANS86941.1 hypothetical protein VSVS12_03232 [Vibrio scophthalmi]EGU36919.1 hypothetical protein VII00023_08299 [Vibrio ichthyoenteri ATCC 700023]ODS05167.1 hypothetical protein VSF3289_04308 [Vibrio scophthalmi]